MFLVPLRTGGFARGVVARSRRQGRVLFGYFFGPMLPAADSVKTCDLDPASAVWMARFGDLGLVNGEWRIVGDLSPWDRSAWPMPDFIRLDPMDAKKAKRIRYSDADPMVVESTKDVEAELPLPSDGMHGYGSIEIGLTKLFPPQKGSGL